MPINRWLLEGEGGPTGVVGLRLSEVRKMYCLKYIYKFRKEINVLTLVGINILPVKVL